MIVKRGNVKAVSLKRVAEEPNDLWQGDIMGQVRFLWVGERNRSRLAGNFTQLSFSLSHEPVKPLNMGLHQGRSLAFISFRDCLGDIAQLHSIEAFE